MAQTTLAEAPAKIARRETVSGNSIRARACTPNSQPYGTGVLPHAFAHEFNRAADAGIISYVVYSYATPIAWVLKNGEVIVPAVRYSVTTSRHQGVVCRGFAGMSFGFVKFPESVTAATTAALAELVSA
jgi:hypothetical protein